MEAVKAWATTICLAALAAGIAGIIAPNGKMEKAYKFAVSLFFLCCMLVPLFNIKNVSLSNVRISTTVSSVSNREMSSTISQQKCNAAGQNIAALIKKCCKDCGAEPANVSVKMASSEKDGSISVSSAEVTLKTADLIKKEKISGTILNKLGIGVTIKDGGK